MAEAAGKYGDLLENDIKCGVCGETPKRTKLPMVDRIQGREYYPLSWWQTFEFWRRHGMGKSCSAG